MPLHTDAFTHRLLYYHTDTFTHRRFYTQNSFWHSSLISCEGCRRRNEIAQKHLIFETRTSFRTEGLLPPTVFDARTSFRAKGLPPSCERVATEDVKTISFWHWNLISCGMVAISWRLVRTACGLKREKKKKERDGDRGQEREREDEDEDVSMFRYEIVKMWRCIADLHRHYREKHKDWRPRVFCSPLNSRVP